MKDFKDKVVVITGASSGIGEALAYEFGALGAKVVCAARSGDRLTLVADNIIAQGGEAVAVATDVSREDDCRQLIDAAVLAFGGVDVLVCNAGISMRAILDDVELDVLRRLVDVNFWGTVYCVKYALPYLQKARGSIVGVSSVAGLHGLPGRTGYSASKYAMTGFLETVRIENLHKGLHVMVACPGFTATNVRFTALTKDGSPQGQTPREEGKMMSAEEVAQRIIKGIRRRKRLLLMEWEGRGTHWIKKFAPSLLDRLFYLVMSQEPDSPLAKRRETKD
ncbi:MAG: SDR family oxidoreductase [Rikenellaceae bacterium]|jgi:NAD(P)-dependent dehydrogenase (short-subunit alcohol dehydrogenase family)|nr:SDR family oxidoreductase [Rikenellaceae bacterium]